MPMRKPRQKSCVVCPDCMRARSAAIIYTGDSITVDRAMEIVENMRDPVIVRTISPEAVIDCCMAVSGCLIASVRDNFRTRKIVAARTMAAVTLRDICHLSYPVIGGWLGRRGHSTGWTAYHRTSPEQRTAWVAEVERRLAA